MNAERKYKAVEGLFKSAGWRIVKDILEAETITLARKSARQYNASPTERAYYAGVLEASERLIAIDQAILGRFHGEMLLEQAAAAKNPGSATTTKS